MITQIKKYAYAFLSSSIGRQSKIQCLNQTNIIETASQEALLKIFKKHAVYGISIAFTTLESDVLVSAGLLNNISLVENNSIFRLASISKLIVGICIFKMQDLGLLNVDEDVNKYINVKNPYFPQKSIKIRHLLSHTSSIVDSENYFKSFNNPMPYNRVLQYLENEPGKFFKYSNLAAGLLEIIIEKASATSFEKALKQFVFNPLNIKCCLFPRVDSEIASSYRVFPKVKLPNYEFDKNIFRNNQNYQDREVDYHYIKAAGAIYSNALDVLTILKSITSENSILSQNSIKQMHEIVAEYPDKTRQMYSGLSVEIIKDKNISPNTIYGHQGFAYGAAMGAFYDFSNNKAIVSLNNGAKEWRNGHFSCLNEDVINWYYTYF